ncbi:MAG: HlyD family efflux transporter periplasmic adaptor subunit [Mailhella sp.]|nr:HlyD family efflux transporter periplasmic adaptor subunit [Mailhella sp.]
MRSLLPYCFSVLPLFFLPACEQEGDAGLPGYVEGDYIYVSAEASGTITSIAAAKGAPAAAAGILFTLDDEAEKLAVQKAEQAVAEAGARLADMRSGKRAEEMAVIEEELKRAEAEASSASSTLARYERFFKQGGISRQELETYRLNAARASNAVEEVKKQLLAAGLPSREKQAEAQEALLRSAEIASEEAKIILAKRTVLAPADGTVTNVYYHAGEWVQPGAPVVQLLPAENRKVRFFVPEYLAGDLHPGTAVHVSGDSVAPFDARITYISDNAEYTPPVIYSKEHRSQLSFMAEAIPASPDDAARLRPGQPVSVRFR